MNEPAATAAPDVSTSDVTLGPIDLRVPADPSLARAVRLAASGLASMGPFTVDEIEDLKLAVSEVVNMLIEHGADDSIELRLAITGNAFVVDGTATTTTFDPEHPDVVLSRSVLDTVCAEHHLTVADGVAHLHAVVRHLELD